MSWSSLPWILMRLSNERARGLSHPARSIALLALAMVLDRTSRAPGLAGARGR